MNLSPTRVGGYAALGTVLCFVVGIAFMATSGVQVLIPEPGAESLEWIADVEDAGGPFFIGAWLVVFGGLIGLLALVCFYDALRGAGPLLLLAPFAATLGLTLVTVSHVLPIAVAYELVPGYTAADGAARESIAVTHETLASFALVTNYAGNALNWGLVVPLYAWAILRTGVVPRWIGWLGFVVAFFAGWLGLLGPASSVIEGITTIGFLGFFVFLASMGVALLRVRERSDAVEIPPVTT